MKMDLEEFNQIITTIVTSAAGDPTIITGLPDVDLANEQLKFTRALEICEKIETFRQHNPEQAKHYNWYDNLGLTNVREELAQFWAEHRVGE